MAKALAVDQLCGSGDPETVNYWLEEYVRERQLPLHDAHISSLARVASELERLEKENAILVLALTVARTRLEAFAGQNETTAL